MKFDFVIGTPLYHDIHKQSNSTHLRPVYHLFVNEAFTVATKVQFIIPARFLSNIGGTPKKWNKEILNNPHLKILMAIPKSTLFFPETDIRGGLVIIYWDIDKIFKPINNFVNNNKLSSAIDKVKKTNFIPLSELVSTQSSISFTEQMYLEHPKIEKLSLSRRYALASNIFNKLEDIVFFENKPIDDEEYVQIYGRKNNKRKYMWIKKKYIQESKNFDKYKVMLPASNGSGAIGEVLSTPLIGKPLIGKPLIGHTETFLTIGCFETEDEASNCLKYVKTKFARAMLGAKKKTQYNGKDTWKCVPQQNFSFTSDIDWGKRISEIDAQLYRKYNLAEDEIEFIESNLRPMND